MGSKLDDFRTPANVTEGVMITLDNGLEVRVALPTMANRKYQFDVLRNISDEENSGVRYEAMIGSFNRVCILEIPGEDIDLPLDEDEFSELINALFLKASELARAEDEAREERTKKPRPT